MIGLLPIRGSVLSRELIEDLREELPGVFGLDVKLMPDIDIKPFLNSYNEFRGQFLASMIVYRISGIRGSLHALLGITDVDLYERGMNFVFGVAIPPLRGAIISTYRLDPRFYGKPFNYEKLRERTLKEAVHELGHVFGLAHCANPRCVMHFSNSIFDTDFKGWRFCEKCEEKVKYNISRLKEGKGND